MMNTRDPLSQNTKEDGSACLLEDVGVTTTEISKVAEGAKRNWARKHRQGRQRWRAWLARARPGAGQTASSLSPQV